MRKVEREKESEIVSEREIVRHTGRQEDRQSHTDRVSSDRDGYPPPPINMQTLYQK